MEITSPVPFTAAVLFLCAFLRSAVGFGDALLAVPLLGMAMSLSTASPVVAFAGVTMSATIFAGNREKVDFHSAWRLALASLAGIPFGVLLLRSAPEETVKQLLGWILALYGAYGLLSPRAPYLRSERFAFPFGFVAGLLGGAYNTSGPPVIIYATFRRWPPPRFRATLQFFFLFTYSATIVGHGIARLWTGAVFELFLWALPGILLGLYLGGRMHSMIPAGIFNRMILAILLLLGVLLLR